MLTYNIFTKNNHVSKQKSRDKSGIALLVYKCLSWLNRATLIPYTRPRAYHVPGCSRNLCPTLRTGREGKRQIAV